MSFLKKIFNRPLQPNICGGYISRNEHCSKADTAGSRLTELYYSRYIRKENVESLNITLASGEFKVSILKDQWHLAYEYSSFADENLVEKVTEIIVGSGILDYNKLDVEVSGLPPCDDCKFSAEFENGCKAYVRFNGGHMPAGFSDTDDRIIEEIITLTGYSPEKCKEAPKYVNPFYGEHDFEYTYKNKSEKIVCTLHDPIENHNGLIKASGDFGDFEIICDASKVYGGKTKYFYYVAEYLSDSNEKLGKGDLAAILTKEGEEFGIEFCALKRFFSEKGEIKSI
ncbi:MAG: hypothetical protein KBS44_07850 [Clostridiales bacterium]|nr:hypothetical protein [Candidatus Coliplasma equi]